VLTKESLVTVPAQTGLYPYISATLFGPPSNNCVTLANNNTVNGVRIKSNGNTIYADSVTNGTITNNIIQGSGTDVEGITLQDVAGTWNITANTIKSDRGLYLASSEISLINILQNTFQNDGKYNLQALIDGAGESNINIKQNTFTNSKCGLAAEILDTANVVIRMTDNTFSNIVGSSNPSDPTSALTIESLNSSNLTALLARNTLNVSSQIATAIIADDNSTGFFVLQGNNSSTSSSSPQSIGITVSTLGNSTATVALNNNSASGAAQIFLDQGGTSTYYLQSPNLSLSGVQSLNPGQIQTNGNITYVPYAPPTIK
jgi:hypothetical protein